MELRRPVSWPQNSRLTSSLSSRTSWSPTLHKHQLRSQTKKNHPYELRHWNHHLYYLLLNRNMLLFLLTSPTSSINCYLFWGTNNKQVQPPSDNTTPGLESYGNSCRLRNYITQGSIRQSLSMVPKSITAETLSYRTLLESGYRQTLWTQCPSIPPTGVVNFD